MLLISWYQSAQSLSFIHFFSVIINSDPLISAVIHLWLLPFPYGHIFGVIILLKYAMLPILTVLKCGHSISVSFQNACALSVLLLVCLMPLDKGLPVLTGAVHHLHGTMHAPGDAGDLEDWH